MGIAELIEIALAGSGPERVEVAVLEPADITIEAVSTLSQMIAELIENGLAFSDPGGRVRLTGLYDQQDYLISISDRGVGVPEDLMTELNNLLHQPGSAVGAEPSLGIALIARLAARHGIEVRLVPGVPGTTARLRVPARLIAAVPPSDRAEQTTTGRRLPAREALRSPRPQMQPVAPSPGGDEMLDLTRLERDVAAGAGVVAMSEEGRREAERLLERVFGPLRDHARADVEPSPKPSSNGKSRSPEPVLEARRPARRASGNVTTLRVRVPGENFSVVADDPSTLAGERAVDIRSALTRYEQGRRSAATSSDR